MSRSGLLRAAAVGALVAMTLPATAGVQAKGKPGPGGGSSQAETVVRLGSVTMSSIGKSTTSTQGSYTAASELSPSPDADKADPKSKAAPTHLGNTPNPKGTTITTSNPGVTAFNGVSHADQRNVGTGIYANTQFSLEPPDQGLCTNGTYVVEPVNNAMTMYKTDGSVAKSVVALSQFWGLAPEIDRSNAPNYVYGPSVSDPRCYYDVSTSHWFLTELEYDVDASSGLPTGPSHQLIAVSTTSDPTGGWNLYSFATTDDGTDGTPSHAGCPCFGDQPLIGADANGFYISTNEYPWFTDGFNGAQIYAVSKSLLESGAASIPLVHLQGGSIPASSQYPGGVSYSVQPASVPTTKFDTSNGGTEYFLSSAEFSGYFDNRVIAWALTNTSSLNSATPNVTLQNTIVNSETYGMGGNDFGVPQNSGSRPLEQTLPGNSNPEELNANDDRMNQTVYADGLLWSGLNTLTVDQNGVNHVGIAYFVVSPSFSNGTLNASMASQGYVSVNGNVNTFFPSIGVNDQGNGVLAFSLSGSSYYPSAGYVAINTNGVSGQIHMYAQGQAPDDGFTGYAAYGGNGIARWGDYSAAVADPSGKSVWIANEWIPGGNRTLLANWGTVVGNVPLS